MTRIAIVEDEAAVREQLAGYVQRYTRQYGTPFEVTEFADGMEILEDYRPHDRYADDPQDLRLCVDRSHRLFCYEEGM